MAAGRPKLPPRRQIILRIDEGLLARLYTMNPKLMDVTGSTRYGEMNKYFTNLLVKDLARREAGIKKSDG